jgi:hypothetical protein
VRSGKPDFFPGRKYAGGLHGGVGPCLATADLPTATNHTGLQTQGGGSYNAVQVTARAKIDLARQLDLPAAAARGLSQAVGGEPRLTYRGRRRKGAESKIRRLPSRGVSV